MKEIMKSKIEELLPKEYYCSLKDLNEKGPVYSVNSEVELPYIKIMADAGMCLYGLIYLEILWMEVLYMITSFER